MVWWYTCSGFLFSFPLSQFSNTGSCTRRWNIKHFQHETVWAILGSKLQNGLHICYGRNACSTPWAGRYPRLLVWSSASNKIYPTMRARIISRQFCEPRMVAVFKSDFCPKVQIVHNYEISRSKRFSFIPLAMRKRLRHLIRTFRASSQVESARNKSSRRWLVSYSHRNCGRCSGFLHIYSLDQRCHFTRWTDRYLTGSNLSLEIIATDLYFCIHPRRHYGRLKMPKLGFPTTNLRTKNASLYKTVHTHIELLFNKDYIFT